MSVHDLLLDKALSQVSRILGFMDRDESSLTYGCCDRAFWHYRTIDFANARFQESAQLLAMVYLTPNPKNRFYQSDQIKAWALAAGEYWLKSRHSDGSVDESYPNERHFCATAFSLHATTQMYLMLNEKPSESLIASAEFIAHQNMPDVPNQMACAAAALFGVCQLTKDKRWQLAAEVKLSILLKLQTAQGNFLEYGGFDLGYDTLTLSLLARINARLRSEDISKASLRLAEALDKGLDEDGYFDNKDMSRRTQFVYPFGFAVFRQQVLEKIEQGLLKDVILNPAWMDDRYCIGLTTDYWLASSYRGKA